MENLIIGRFMVHDPITIDRGEPISHARRLMQTHNIRHLPVIHAGKLVGIVSQRDLQRFDSIADLDPRLVPVGEAMTKPPYAVHADAPLREVADQMASRHCGSVVVVDEQQRVLGLLTAGGGLRALSSLIEAPPPRA
jgi:acetoin utilization protein AcuB